MFQRKGLGGGRSARGVVAFWVVVGGLFALGQPRVDLHVRSGDVDFWLWTTAPDGQLARVWVTRDVAAGAKSRQSWVASVDAVIADRLASGPPIDLAQSTDTVAVAGSDGLVIFDARSGERTDTVTAPVSERTSILIGGRRPWLADEHVRVIDGHSVLRAHLDGTLRSVVATDEGLAAATSQARYRIHRSGEVSSGPTEAIAPVTAVGRPDRTGWLLGDGRLTEAGRSVSARFGPKAVARARSATKAAIMVISPGNAAMVADGVLWMSGASRPTATDCDAMFGSSGTRAVLRCDGQVLALAPDGGMHALGEASGRLRSDGRQSLFDGPDRSWVVVEDRLIEIDETSSVAAVGPLGANRDVSRRAAGLAGEVGADRASGHAAQARCPSAVDDEIRLGRSQAVEIDVVANDVDANSDPLVVTDARVVSGPTVGRVAIAGPRRLRFRPTALGVSRVRYEISDGSFVDGRLCTTVGTVVFVVGPQRVEHPPQVQPDRAHVSSSGAHIDVLANDYDPDGDELHVLGPVRIQPVAAMRATIDGDRLRVAAQGVTDAVATYSVSDGAASTVATFELVDAAAEGSVSPDVVSTTELVSRIDVVANDPVAAGGGWSAVEVSPASFATASDGVIEFRAPGPGVYRATATVQGPSGQRLRSPILVSVRRMRGAESALAAPPPSDAPVGGPGGPGSDHAPGTGPGNDAAYPTATSAPATPPPTPVSVPNAAPGPPTTRGAPGVAPPTTSPPAPSTTVPVPTSPPTTVPPPPGAVTDLRVETADDRAWLRFTAPSGAALERFDVVVSPEIGSVPTSSAATSIPLDGFVEGAAYELTVRAIGADERRGPAKVLRWSAPRRPAVVNPTARIIGLQLRATYVVSDASECTMELWREESSGWVQNSVVNDAGCDGTDVYLPRYLERYAIRVVGRRSGLVSPPPNCEEIFCAHARAATGWVSRYVDPASVPNNPTGIFASPDLAAAQLGSVPNRTIVKAACYTDGPVVGGSTRWLRVQVDSVSGWYPLAGLQAPAGIYQPSEFPFNPCDSPRRLDPLRQPLAPYRRP